MSLEFIDSVLLNSKERIRIPSEANCMAIKKRRCIFAKSEDSPRHYHPIPNGAQSVHFPQYHEHSNRYVSYGPAVFD